MADEWAPPQPKKSKPRWLRLLLWIGGGGLLLLVLLYFFLTSAFFLRSFVLPRVGSAINAAVTVGDASISPFSSITLKDLRLMSGDDPEPLVIVKEVRARCNLMDIIGGHINVEEVTLDSPVVHIVQNPDGTSNLDPLLKSSGEKNEAEPSEQPSKPLQIDLKKLSLQNASVQRVKLRSDGGKELAELANININLDNLRNGDTANLTVSSGISLQQSSSGALSSTASNLLQSDLNGGFDIALSDELVPQTVKGKLSLKVTHAAGALRSLAGIEASLECALTPTNLEDLLLTFTQEGKPLGRVSLKGPLDVNKREGRLNLEVSGTDRQALNLAGAAVGVDFGTATVSSTHEITLAQGNLTGGGVGLPVPGFPPPFDTPRGTYWLILGIAVLVTWLTWNVARHTWGRGLVAVRDSAVTAQAVGVPVFRAKLTVFIFSGFTAGVAGALFAVLQSYITPDTFVFELGLFFFVCIIIGGRGHILGPAIGTIVLTALPEMVAPLAKLGNFFYGLLLLAVVLLVPEGIGRVFELLIEHFRPRRGESHVVKPDLERLVRAIRRGQSK